VADSPSKYGDELRGEWNNVEQAYKEEKERPLGWFEDVSRQKKLYKLYCKKRKIEGKLIIHAISTCQQCSEATYDKCEEGLKFLEENNIFWRCDKAKICISEPKEPKEGFSPGYNHHFYIFLAAMYLDLSPNCPPHKTIVYGLKKAVEKTQNDENKRKHESFKAFLEVAQQAEKEKKESAN